MPNPALITTSDMAAYGYSDVADGFKNRASARVRRYTGQLVTPGSSTVTMFGDGPWLLTSRPVVAVTSVTSGGNAVEYELRGQVLYSEARPPITVAFTHGFATLPDRLVELVCEIAFRLAAQSAAVASGVRQETAGIESVTWSNEALEGASGLVPSEERQLDQIFPRRLASGWLI